MVAILKWAGVRQQLTHRHQTWMQLSVLNIVILVRFMEANALALSNFYGDFMVAQTVMVFHVHTS